MLDGNQVGALLADYALSLYGSAATPLVLNSVVSSPLVGLLAVAGGAHYERTLTGFKWLWSAALELERRGVGRFCFAYEEALGYSYFRQFATKTASRPGERSRSYPQRSRLVAKACSNVCISSTPSTGFGRALRIASRSRAATQALGSLAVSMHCPGKASFGWQASACFASSTIG